MPSPNGRLTIMIVEDQRLVLGALAALLELEDDLSVAATAANGREALERLRACPVDIVLTDIEMPEMGGIDLARAICDGYSATQVVILTTFARSGYLRRALDAGARAYLLKDSPSEALAHAIRKVAAGARVVDPELAADALTEHDPLTDRERQILSLVNEGLGNARIGERLCLSEGTVRNYLSEVNGKLGAANRVEAARIAREKGWIEGG